MTKNIVDKTMENLETPWSNWCRLCAKEDSDNNVYINFGNGHQKLAADEDVKLKLNEAMEKYFLVQSSCEDLLPKHLCQDCYSLISSIMVFNEHVERVQEMYNFLMEAPIDDSTDLKSVRLKFDVCNENIGKWFYYQNKQMESDFEDYQNTEEVGGVESPVDHSIGSVHLKIDICDDNRAQLFNFQNKKRDSISENNYNTRGSCETESLTTLIKEENWSIESDLSDYEENTDIICQSICKGQVEYDEYIGKDNQEENEKTFKAMSEDSFWGEDEDMTKNHKSARKKTDTNTVEASKLKRNQRNLRDIYCETKTRITEDFVLDVTCAACEQKFDLYSKYCEHMETSHGKLAGVDKSCPLCDRTLQTWYHLGRHMRYHMPLESRYPIKCPECDNRYTSNAQLEVHIKHKHKNEKPFICEVCGFCGATKNSLTQHMYVHTDEAPFECEVCKKRFKKRSRLNFHMDIHGPNKFVCSICGLQLNSRATLKNHMHVHSEKKRHKCDYCGKSFKQSKTLKGHLLVHVGLKPYSCSFCELSYSNRSVCLAHMKKVHPNELTLLQASGNKAYTKNVPKLETLKAVTKSADYLKPVSKNKGNISCNYCDGKFSYRTSVRYHMKIKHPAEYALLQGASNKKLKIRKAVTKIAQPKTPTEPVECDFCGRIFGNRKNCRNHMKRMHPDELSSLGASNNQTHTANIGKSGTPERVTKSMESSTLPLELDPCESTTAVTNIQDLFLLID